VKREADRTEDGFSVIKYSIVFFPDFYHSEALWLKQPDSWNCCPFRAVLRVLPAPAGFIPLIAYIIPNSAYFFNEILTINLAYSVGGDV